ncbi:beta-ketoacyl-ACP synthase III [Streptomyces noursei]|uniref:beta-ketoacyl-ACP synthase III n=1 Tax=Streptomyces noursei TaxID=1971 RepID=UPI00167268F7|nr:beta-ketoacyl-ACP synthase III [Streptomyces noursei]MCZ1020445.1 ketoacyl-ACP synthase III [Streptomyces noursei]GGX13769.1 3-oxoacyl-[acyl-carrier-protein] synthase 3 protein 3 [Streptomyces noursei]
MYESEDSAQAPAATTAVLTGLGAWLPPREVTNDELCAHLDTSDAWIRERIGISVRRRADPKTATGDLAAEAGARALRSAGVTQADTVVLATTTPDHPCPATAPDVAARLGLGNAAAFDIAAGCSGFLYATTVAAGLIRSGTAGRVLVIGAETMSAVIDPEDRATAPIFGDGAGAAVLEAGRPGQAGSLGEVVWGSDGERADAIVIPVGGSRNRDGRDAAPQSERHVRMRGNEVLRHAVRRMTAAATRAAAAAGWALADVDRLIVHQANARISAAVSDALGIPPERVPSNIATVGNTAAASIPLLLTDAAAEGALRPGDRVLLVAFGSGLAWAATTLVWPAGLQAER